MPLSWNEIKERAITFQKEWQGVTSEKAEAQSFWNEFFPVFGVSRRRVASFEQPIKKGDQKQGFIDLLWKGVILIEHKSRGKDLDRAVQQAKDYFPGLKDHELPRYILVSDFERFRLYDLETDQQSEFTLGELVNSVHLFDFIAGYEKRVYKDEDPVNIKAAELMGKLHDALKDIGYSGHDLEVYLVRLLFCLFADDTGIFNTIFSTKFMRYTFHTLDVFTDQIFGGNPLAVFPDAQGLSSTQMQQIAAEINYSETVFVLPPESAAGDFQLRIFTPTQELDFAGHPTVGTAFLLGKLQVDRSDQTLVTWQLEELVGLVPVTLYYDEETLVKTELTVAQLPHVGDAIPSMIDLGKLLDLRIDQIKQDQDFPQGYSCGLPFLFVPLVDREALGQIQFNLSIWQTLWAGQWANCIYCFAPSDPTRSLTDNQILYGRMFAPGLGITEDPATGSAVAALGGYFGDRLQNQSGTFTWQIEQGIEMGRPSQLILTVVKNYQAIETVKVAGRSVLVSEGIMTLPSGIILEA